MNDNVDFGFWMAKCLENGDMAGYDFWMGKYMEILKQSNKNHEENL